MRFEKQTKSVTCVRSVRCLAPPTAAVNYHVHCCCGKRQDRERSAGRVGKLETLWHCSGCVSIRGRALLLHTCTDSEEKLLFSLSLFIFSLFLFFLSIFVLILLSLSLSFFALSISFFLLFLSLSLFLSSFFFFLSFFL